MLSFLGILYIGSEIVLYEDLCFKEKSQECKVLEKYIKPYHVFITR